MKTLTNHTIVYDDECPMCQVYTQAFVKTGMLDGMGRITYANLANDDIPNMDWKRARTEIALINWKDNSVVYGVESLTKIIGNSMPQFKPLFNKHWFQFLISRLYFFISYNRKVIAPGATFEDQSSCAPELNYAYRWAYIIFAWLMTSVVLLFFTRMIGSFVSETSYAREFLICGGQIIFQGTLVAWIKRDRWIHYLGHLMTVSLAGALLLTPLFILNNWIQNQWFFIGYFLVVVGWMFLTHLKRVKIIELPWFLSATWVLYRLMVLWIIL